MAKKLAKKRRNGKKYLISIGFVVLAGGYVALALSQPLLSIEATTTIAPPAKAATAVALDWPKYGQAAVGAPGYGVLASQGDQTPLPTASIAKVLTAMAVLRQRPLHVGEQGPDIIINQADVDSYNDFVAADGSVVGVGLGERISEYQALQALLLPSANNIAVTLARWAFGSVEAYNTYANSYAKQLGLKSVRITDPSGYDVKTVASAHDLTLLGTLAMTDPVFAEIVAQPTAKIPVHGTIYNYNFQLGKAGNIGIKTGNNDGNKGAFLFANKQIIDGQTVTIIGAIMGGPDLSTVLRDSQPLGRSTLEGFSESRFIKAGENVGTYTIPGQGTISAVAAADLGFLTWSNMGFKTTAALQPLTAAGPAGTKVGTITVTNSVTKVTNSVPVTLLTAAKKPSLTWRLTHPLGN